MQLDPSDFVAEVHVVLSRCPVFLHLPSVSCFCWMHDADCSEKPSIWTDRGAYSGSMHTLPSTRLFLEGLWLSLESDGDGLESDQIYRKVP